MNSLRIHISLANITAGQMVDPYNFSLLWFDIKPLKTHIKDLVSAVETHLIFHSIQSFSFSLQSLFPSSKGNIIILL
jgi:hypothetical protein